MEDDLSDGYALVYAEAVRALTQQREAFESLRARAGALLSGAAIASSLFGGRAVDHGHLGVFGWLAVAAFARLGFAVLAVLWPRTERRPTARPSRMIAQLEGPPEPPAPSVVYRELALQMEALYDRGALDHLRLSRRFRLPRSCSASSPSRGSSTCW